MRWRAARPPTPLAGGDDLLVRRATITIAALTAGAVAVVVAAVVLLAVGLTIREQHIDGDRIVSETATTAEDVKDPPPNVSLLLHRSGGPGNDVSAGTPWALAALDVQRLPVGPSQVALGGHEYRLYVSDRDGTRV